MSGKVFNYQNGKIYKLCCKDPSITDIYVGSTLNQYQRKARHKIVCNNPNGKFYNMNLYQFIRAHGGFDEWNLIVLEEYAAENKNDLLWKEREWVEKLQPSLNSIRPIATKEENDESARKWCEENKEYIKEQQKNYREEHREEIKENKAKYYQTNQELFKELAKKRYENNKEKVLEYQKEYRKNNKDKISKQRLEKVECEFCKIYTSKSHLARHRKSQRHIDNEKKLTAVEN